MSIDSGASPLTRRRVIRGLAAAAGLGLVGGSGLLGRVARATDPAADRYYVFADFAGGWDILLGLDPRDPALFSDVQVPRTLIQPGYARLPAAFQNVVRLPDGRMLGPYGGGLARHASRLAVVRGMSMETLDHLAGKQRFLTGKVPSGVQPRGSAAASWLASHLGASDLIANLSIGCEAYNQDLPAYASPMKVGAASDLRRALKVGSDRLVSPLQRIVDRTQNSVSLCDDWSGSAVRADGEVARQRARALELARLDAVFDFLADTPEMNALRARYGFARSESALDDPEAQAAIAAQALTMGISRAVSFRAATGLDTHDARWATDQGPAQKRGFDAVATLADDLASREYKNTGRSWLDHTVIVGLSEFSRTALLNDSGGRDHSLTNACFVLGGPVRAGNIGASADLGLAAQPIDLTTGRVDPAGVVPRPEHVLQALFEDAGLGSQPDLRVPPLRALLRTL